MPPLASESLMGSGLGNLAGIQHHNLGGAADGGQAVRNHDDGAAFHQHAERLLDQHFRFGVEMGSRFVENQDGRILQ